MITERSAITEPVRRLEVFTGAGRRRRWSAEDKARIVAESLTSAASVCSVARRHGLSPQQLFGWRRDARQAAGAGASAGLFVPVVVEASTAAPPEEAPRQKTPPLCGRVEPTHTRSSVTIELEIGGVTVRICRDAEAQTIETVIRALKAGA